ncbi:cupin domain-containing protein [soil metagenome]
MKPIIHLDDVELEHHQHGTTFEARDGSVAAAIGARQLGCALTVVPPGKRAWPFHNHHINEELFLILDGTGTVRIGAETFPIRAGDVIAAPPGDATTAHQIINTGDRDLRYLAISTMQPQEVVEYPDAGKVAIYVGSAPGQDPAPRTFNYRGRLGPAAEYWDGEPI